MVPESPRWLVTKGRFDEALKILKGGAKMNKKTLPSDNEMLEMMEKIKLQDEQDAPPEEEVKTFKEKVCIIFNQLFVVQLVQFLSIHSLKIFFQYNVGCRSIKGTY